MSPKVQSMEEKLIGWTPLKLKNICSGKDNVNGMKGQATEWEKYLQKMHLIKDYCTKYSKKPSNSTVRKWTTWLKNKSKTLTDASPKKICHQGNANSNNNYTPIRMAKTPLHTYYNGQNPEHWQHQVLMKCGTVGKLIHCWWDCKMACSHLRRQFGGFFQRRWNLHSHKKTCI